jgi:hypothetical protein
MNKQDQYEEDILRQYINPERIEKAPEGFTAKTMTRIRIETQSVKVHRRLYKNPVVLISVIITAVLILAVVFIPANSSESIGMSVLKWAGDPKISFPLLDFKPLPDLGLPGWGIYALIGVLFLAFFDKGLSVIFKKENN